MRILSLCGEAKLQIPYQNHSSDLQDSVCGTAKALMFVNCPPAESFIYEILVFLKYATRVEKTMNLGGDSWLRHFES